MTDNKRPVSVSQGSGVGSSSNQDQNVFVDGEHNHYHGDAFKKLAKIHDSQLTFDPSALKQIIMKIDEGIDEIDHDEIDFSTSIDIDQKNILNNHSQDYFEEFIEIDFYPKFYKLDQFLALKANQRSLQPQIDRVIKSLNMKIRAHQGSERFEIILLKICDTLIDRNHEKLQDKEAEILLILYYFYCNCCIGKKTEEEV